MLHDCIPHYFQRIERAFNETMQVIGKQKKHDQICDVIAGRKSKRVEEIVLEVIRPYLWAKNSRKLKTQYQQREKMAFYKTTRLYEVSCPCVACQKYYSISTVAAKLDYSVSRIRQFVKKGILKTKLVNGAKRIPHSELLKIIK